jgi:putative endonuclease
MKEKYFIYAILCSNKTVYIGQTSDLQQRWKMHVKGKGAQWTKKYPPVSLFYFEEAESLIEAMRREKELKKSTGRKMLKELLKTPRKHLLKSPKEKRASPKKTTNSKTIKT